MTYPEVGDYALTIWASNDQSYLVTSIVACVGQELAGIITMGPTDISIDSVSKLNLDFAAGTNMTFEGDMGDGAAVYIEPSLGDFGALPPTLDYAYVLMGKYEVNATMCNCLGCLSFQLETIVGLPITSSTFNTTSPTAKGTNTTFTAVLSNSSETSCVITFGSTPGEYFGVYQLFTEDPIVVEFYYPEVGNYTTSLYCENCFGDIYHEEVVFVDEMILNFTANITQTSITVGDEVAIEVNVVEGTNVEFSAECDEVPCGTVTINTPSRSATILIAGTDIVAYGTHNVTLIASNAMGQETILVDVNADELITATYCEKDITYFIAGVEQTVKTICPTGSRVSFQLYPKDLEDLLLVVYYDDDTHNTTFPVLYGDAAYLDMELTCANNVSVATNTCRAGVEFPVPADANSIGITYNNVSEFTDLVTLSLAVDSGDNDTTSAECEIDFTGDGSDNVTAPAFFTIAADGADFEASYTYDDFGYYDAVARCYNNVSEIVFPVGTVMVGLEVVNCNVTASHTFVLTGGTVTAEFHVDEGSGVIYNYTTGEPDIAPITASRTSNVWADPDDTSQNYVYTTPGTFQPSLECSNGFGTVTTVLAHQIVVQTPMPPIKLVMADFHAIGDSTVNLQIEQLNPGDPTPSAPISCDWEHSDGTTETTDGAALAAGNPVVHSSTEVVVGGKVTTVNCSNAVSSETATFSFTAQARIQVLSATPAATAFATNEAAVVVVAMSAGSHVSSEMNFGDGTANVTQQHPNALDSTPEVEFLHTYTTSGNYTISLTSSNGVSSETASAEVIIQRVIPPTGHVFTHDPYNDLVSPVTFELTPPSQLDDAFLDMDYGNGEVGNMFLGDQISTRTFQKVFAADSAPPDLTTMNLNISNMISFAVVTSTIKLENPIVGFTCPDPVVDPTAVLTDQTITFQPTATGGTDLNFSVSNYSLNAPAYVVTQDSEGGSADISHAWTTPGNHTVTCAGGNYVSNDSVVIVVNVLHPIMRPDVIITVSDTLDNVPNKTVVRNGVFGTMTVTIDLVPGAIVPTTVFVDVTYKTGDAPVEMYIDSFPFTFETPSYSTRGEDNMQIDLSNAVSSEQFTWPFIVEELLSVPQIEVPSIPTFYTFPLEILHVTISTGTYYTLTVDYANGHVTTSYTGNEAGPNFHNESGYVYPLPGPYQIVVTANNSFSTETASVDIIIVADLPNMTAECDSPRELLTGMPTETHFILIIEPEDLLPLDVDLWFDPGLPPTAQTTLTADKSLSGNITWEWVYTSPGFYYTSSVVSTLFDNKTHYCIMSVQVRVSPVTIRVSRPGSSVLSSTYISGNSIQMEAFHQVGTGANYTFTVVNQITNELFHTEVTNNTFIPLTMGYPGPYVISVVVDNGIGNLEPGGTFPRTASTAILVNPNGIIYAFDYVVTASMGEFMFYKLILEDSFNTGSFSFDDVCVHMRLGNDLFYFSSEAYICVELYAKDGKDVSQLVTVMPGQKTYSIRHKFDEAGLIPLLVNVTEKNNRFTNMVDGAVNVTVYCFPPSVSTKPASKLLSKFRAKEIHVALENFILETRCIATTQVHTSFAIRRYNNYTNSELGDVITLTENTQVIYKADGMYIQPTNLDIDYYQIEFKLGMGPGSGGYSSLFGSTTLDLKILPTAFTASFAEQFKQVGNNEDLSLVVAVVNPDFPADSSGYTFTFFCHMLGSEDTWAASNVIEGTSASMIAIPTDASAIANGLGGCFGTGPGVLDVTDTSSNTLVVNSGRMPVNKTYVFSAIVTKNGQSATAQTQIQVESGVFQKISVVCSGANCASKLNFDDMIYMEGTCELCPPNTIYRWKITPKHTTARKKRAVTNLVQQQYTGSILEIPASSLDEGGHYEIELFIEAPDGTTGKMIREVFINFRPRSGTCGSDISEGNITTIFTFSCENWVDELASTTSTFSTQEGAPLDYSYGYVDVFGNIQSLASDVTTLPSGSPDNGYMVTVMCYVTDQYQLSATYSFSVKVEPVSDPTVLADMMAAQANMDISQVVLNLDSNLDQLSLIANEINAAIADLQASGEFVETDINAPYTPAGTQDQEIALQQQNDLLQVTDDVFAQYNAILSSDEVVLSDSQLVDVLTSLDSVPIPPGAYPSTLSASMDIVESLDSLIANLEVDLDDPQSTANAQKIVEAAVSIISKALEASIDALVHDLMTADTFGDAVFDTPLTEEEEARQLNAMLAGEESYQQIQEKAMSVLSTAASITNALAALTVTTSSISTPMMTAMVMVYNPNNPASDQPINIASENGSPESIITLLPNAALTSGSPSAQAVAIDKALFGVDAGGPIDGPVITFSMNTLDANGDPQYLGGLSFVLSQKQMEEDEVPRNCSQEVIYDAEQGMTYMGFSTNINNSAYQISMDSSTLNKDATVTIYMIDNCGHILNCRPNGTHHTSQLNLPNYNLVNPWVATFPNLTGDFYIGIEVDDPEKPDKSQAPSFCLQNGLVRCREYSSITNGWDYDACTVSENSTLGSPTCLCTTPEVQDTDEQIAYSSGFTPPQVNPIDFKNIFKNFADLLGNNMAVFVTVFVILAIYILLLIWARRADRKDIEKWSVLPLIGNLPHCRYFYKISVFTGMRRWSCTKSDIFFILTGDDADTGVMEMKDKKNREFSTGSIRQFVLATEQDLGALTFLRLWHNNGGKGDHASWYLEKILVEDLQTKQRYFFLSGRWFAVDEDDGMIDRILPVAGRDEILRFNHLFFDKTRRKLFDDHLWISLVGRPARSNFSRVQRLTCILCLLFTTMVANAMWYGSAQVESDRALKIGPITLSAATILVSIYGSLTVIPINTIIMMLFRKHRPKEWPADDEVIGTDGQKIKINLTEQGQKKPKWWKQKYPLPYWCAYLAWVLAVLCSLVGAFFVIMYSLEWGKEKAEEWLSSLILSVVQSVVLVQPVKVVLLAAVLALVFKTLDDDDEDIGEQHNNGRAGLDEQFTDENLIKLDNLVKARPPEPLNKKQLAKARSKRRYENLMWTLLKEGGFYFAFLMLVCFIVWGSKNPLIFYTNQMLLEQMAGSSVEDFKADMTNWHSFWEWSQGPLVDQLFFMFNYNNRPGTPRDRQYLSDRMNIRVGPLIMRQVRVKPGSCNTLKVVQSHIIECNDVYSIGDEEDRNFTLNWQLDETNNYTVDQLTRVQKAFKYQSALDLKNIPFWGNQATYGGGGYVANLGTTKGQALALLEDMLKHDWVDYYTRAVFVEFTVYNPNINMFAYVNYALESPATGAILANPKIMAFQLYTRLSGMTLLVVACQVLYFMLIVFFMIREGFRFKRERSEYWKNPWNFVEIFIIILSWGALALYMVREVIGRIVLGDLMDNKEKFTNFSLFANYDEIYWYLVGVVVFLCNIKFLRLLRFNKHITHFAGTLKHARTELLYFSVTFTILFMAFTASGFLIFNRYTLDFNSVIATMESLYAMLIGKFDFTEMQKAGRILAPIYFIMFMLLMFMVVVNMFLGIIGNAYNAVTENPELAGDEYKVVDFILEKAKNYMGMKKHKSDKGAGYMDSMDTLNMRLEALDRHVTDDCRTILGLERQAMRGEHSDMDKGQMMEQDGKKVQKLAFMTKLQQKGSQ